VVAAVHRLLSKCTIISNTANIFVAELYAVLLAIEVTRRSREKNFVIFFDSLSSLQAISRFQIDMDLVQNFTKNYTSLSVTAKVIVMC